MPCERAVHAAMVRCRPLASRGMTDAPDRRPIRDAEGLVEACARRELREEAGITATAWTPLGSYALTLASTARIHLYAARDLTCGPQELTPTEQDFKLAWWPMEQALAAAASGRSLLPAGPLALLLAAQADRIGERKGSIRS